MLRAWGLGLVWVVVLAAGAVGAEAMGVGDRLEPFALEDQHGLERRVDESTAVILFSRDMEGGQLLREAFEGLESDPLAGLGAVYIADISGMPGLVAKLFALPKMRKRPYPLLLDREGTTTEGLPDVEGQATLIFVERLEIVRVEHLDSVEAVRRTLGLGEPTTPE